MRRYRALSIVVSAIAVSALLGGIFGKKLLAADDKVPDHYKAFTAALSAIESGYIDKIDSDRLVYGAVRGMLSTLDPHSSFFDPREYAQMRERQEGHYYGIGIQISAVDGDIIAQFVFEGSPAYKQGVTRLYAAANVRCLPIALNSGLFWPRRKFLRYPGTIVLEVLDPIAPGLDRATFAQRMEQDIEAATARLIAEAERELRRS